MNEEIVEVLKDICSELAWGNILKSYELKMRAKDTTTFLAGEVTKVANSYLNSTSFEE